MVSFSREGMEVMRQAASLASFDEDFAVTGIGEYEGYSVLFIPTRVVSDPVLTVGLGDTISAVSFLAG